MTRTAKHAKGRHYTPGRVGVVRVAVFGRLFAWHTKWVLWERGWKIPSLHRSQTRMILCATPREPADRCQLHFLFCCVIHDTVCTIVGCSKTRARLFIRRSGSADRMDVKCFEMNYATLLRSSHGQFLRDGLFSAVIGWKVQTTAIQSVCLGWGACDWRGNWKGFYSKNIQKVFRMGK